MHFFRVKGAGSVAMPDEEVFAPWPGHEGRPWSFVYIYGTYDFSVHLFKSNLHRASKLNTNAVTNKAAQ